MLSYTYKGLIVRWVDGDTVDIKVDIGFYLTTIQRFRLFDVDTPERGEVNWAEATAMCNKLAPVMSEVEITSYKTDSFGRWLADVSNKDGINISKHLISIGLAVPWRKH